MMNHNPSHARNRPARSPAGRNALRALPAFRNLPRILALALGLLTLAGCATMAPQTDPVVKRAQARWDALVAGDLETAYTYFSPAYRSTTSLIDFGVTMRTRPVRWTGASYKDHSCEERRCVVRFDIEFQVPRPVPGLKVWKGTDVVEDTWVQTGGQWWYLPVKQ